MASATAISPAHVYDKDGVRQERHVLMPKIFLKTLSLAVALSALLLVLIVAAICEHRLASRSFKR